MHQDEQITERERCYVCFRPRQACFCDSIPRIDNQTDVLILQHPRERFHPFNTARIVRHALRKCELITEYNEVLASLDMPIHPNAGLLYPDANAPTIAELSPEERPQQLIMIDGTWHHAKTIMRDVEKLQGIRCVRIAPPIPGQYRIRREPDRQSLSTLEAIAASLCELEPDTLGLDRLLDAFDRMVTDQLNHRSNLGTNHYRKKKQRYPRNVPRDFLLPKKQLVVAYGESTPRINEEDPSERWPVTWLAQRLGSGEAYSELIRPKKPLSESTLAHFRLSQLEFESAVTPEQFRESWARFLRPDDVLIVYHPRTYQLLHNIQATQPDCLYLKSIYGKRRSGFQTLEDLLALEELEVAEDVNSSRGTYRLAMAVCLAEHLHAEFAKIGE